MDEGVKLICFAGLPGSGKTHAANKLAQSTGAVVVSRDEIRSKLFDPVTYSDEEKVMMFGVMLVLASYHLRQGNDVILDGMPFSKRSERDSARKLAEDLGVGFELYHCICPDDVALERIDHQADEHMATDRGWELYTRVKARFEPLAPDEGAIDLNTCEATDHAD